MNTEPTYAPIDEGSTATPHPDQPKQTSTVEPPTAPIDKPVEPTPAPVVLSPEESAERAMRIKVAESETAEQVKTKNLAFMDPTRLNTMMTLAQKFVESGAFPKDMTPQRALVALQAGYERNMQPIEALNSFYFVNGHIAMFGHTVIKIVMDAGHYITWGECDDTKATVTITRGDNGQSMTGSYTIEQARSAGLVSKDNWKNYPANMCKYRAFWQVAPFLVPDALHGISIKEDLEDSQPVDNNRKTHRVASATVAQERPSMKQAIEAKPEAKPTPSADKAATKQPKEWEIVSMRAVEGSDLYNIETFVKDEKGNLVPVQVPVPAKSRAEARKEFKKQVVDIVKAQEK